MSQVLLRIGVVVLLGWVATVVYLRSRTPHKSVPKDSTASNDPKSATSNETSTESLKPIVLTDEEWRERLTPEQFRILRKHGTERAGSGEYAFSKEKGTYRCAGCNLTLFHSRTKFESGTGWPSFWDPAGPGVETEDDYSYLGIHRVEVHCRRCGGHLGHVFDDGPEPTGKRYCINSASLKFEAEGNK